MTDDYKDFGENPGIALTTCTGCGFGLAVSDVGAVTCENCGKPWAEADAPTPADLQLAHMLATNGGGMEQPPRIAPDEVRALLEGAALIIVDLLEIDFIERLTSMDEVPGVYECVYCGERGQLETLFHDDGCPVARAREWRIAHAALAASGDDGGTPA